MQPVVRSVNVGGARSGIRPGGRDTAIDKRPVGAVEVRDPGPRRGGLGSGVVGDDVVSRKHHGGSHQAVYAVAREELDWWGAELGRDLRDGMFGENLTTLGLDVDGAVVGERWRVGSAVLEVAGPRIPCATFGAWMGERGWVRRFTERGRTGAYLAVVEPGMVSAGDVVEVSDRPGHGITVPRVFRAFTGDDEAAARVLAAGILGAEDHGALERRLTRRTKTDHQVPAGTPGPPGGRPAPSRDD
ncbi:MAG TPA: MOSC domain-containing protein [Candidatus Limnocylindria bacterium]|nr:MOSC domain-containing protein [Candidatus Limnocylindria bacterium]